MVKGQVEQLEWNVWDWIFGGNGEAGAGGKG